MRASASVAKGLADTDTLQIVLRSSVDDDPFAGLDSKYSKDLKQFLSVAESQGGKIVRPRLTMDSAEIQTLIEFAQPLAHDAIKVLEIALVAWIHARAGRRTEVSGFGIKIKANTAQEAGQLMDKLSGLKGRSKAALSH